MTIPAFAGGLGARLPNERERAAANQMRKILASSLTTDARFRVVADDTKQDTEIVLTPALSSLLMELLRHVGSGDAVTLVPVSKMLTTQQAADILNVSRPFLISILERGDIQFTTTGRHRRIKAMDLFEYKKKRDAKRGEALATLAEMDAEFL
ncbi:helix-turn-helix domain-containing protein [Labrys wisconsinensis]|uniref:Excisionase family DNA binding protein n=1 Tax=Labrys wisconsinensis TaxID=425677 RepID=A0ABU0JB70_9HYPH|nr:helix-turn-helix domain-containing protein [Labrys wisconsinensis]MDQ0470519.1 excisionase family DNA binding protein [Labrys wisconsinensis]